MDDDDYPYDEEHDFGYDDHQDDDQVLEGDRNGRH